MSFKMSTLNFPGGVREVEVGKGENSIKLGGQNTLPFCSFDGCSGNAAKIGLEITDNYPENWIDSLKDIYRDVADKPSEWAKFVQKSFKPDFICLKFEGVNLSRSNNSIEECAEVARKVAESISIPLVIAGTNNHEKNVKLFEKLADVLDGYNCLFLSAVERNYEAVGTASLDHKYKVGAESLIDINLAKQLNILLNQSGVSYEDIIMNVGSTAVGYGFEYLITTIERIRLAALSQNDRILQMPIITPVSQEAWGVKESLASEVDAPDWGSREERGILIEVSTAASVIAAGSDAVILRHPKSLEAIRKLIGIML